MAGIGRSRYNARMLMLFMCISIAFKAAACLSAADFTASAGSLKVQLSVADGLLNGTIDGRILILFAPNGTDPLDDTDVTSSPDKFFGKNVFKFSQEDTVTLSGGSNDNTAKGVFGWPNVSLNEIPTGSYRVQAFLNEYEAVTRSDGSTISVRFPCGDGTPMFDGPGSLMTSAVDIEITETSQTIPLTFNDVSPAIEFTGNEIGGCSQGNYADTASLRYLKIRSKKLSNFWGRDMYVGANILLPYGYNAKDKKTRYPVIYSQGHWPAGRGAFGYPTASFSAAWDNGTIPAGNGLPDRPTPKMIMVTFRHENPLYDDSYAVNTANLGPYGDAINDELIPQIEKMFNIIREPYARIQQGGSTGGWESIASVIFRPDLFGACFSSYPDSLDFHRHQDIELYTAANAYVRADGSTVPSIRTFVNGTEVVLATTAQENHWELTYGTSSRSAGQWDIWNAVFGIQGYNNYPLEPWDKVTGEIYPGAVEYWKHMDLAQVILSNWNNSRNLGEALRGRIFIYVGTWDTYYLNEGVQEFQKRTDAIGGAGWANVTILANQTHGGNYQRREIWNYLEFLYSFIQDHAPNGTTPLLSNATTSTGRGNDFSEILKYGGRKAAVARQAAPSIQGPKRVKAGSQIKASVGRWDPGVVLTAQWVVDGKANQAAFEVVQGEVVMYSPVASYQSYRLELWVTGTKRNYVTETRESGGVLVVG